MIFIFGAIGTMKMLSFQFGHHAMVPVLENIISFLGPPADTLICSSGTVAGVKFSDRV